MTRLISVAASLAAVSALLAGCQTTPDEPLRATAALQPTQGNKTIGEATFEQVGTDRVRAIVFAQNLKPGQQHGFHIHEGSECGPDGMAAKGHFNPGGKPHGDPSSAERHAGDLPALQAGKTKQGRGKLDVTVSGISLRPGPTSIIGRTLVIHADPDDYRTQPTGNAGARLACGVIKAG